MSYKTKTTSFPFQMSQYKMRMMLTSYAVWLTGNLFSLEHLNCVKPPKFVFKNLRKDRLSLARIGTHTYIYFIICLLKCNRLLQSFKKIKSEM
jgi:hypothetical protein